jgi:hypothetical protein
LFFVKHSQKLVCAIIDDNILELFHFESKLSRCLQSWLLLFCCSLQPAANISAVQSLRPLSTTSVPNGAFSRVQKAVSAFSADGGVEMVSSRQQSVATLLNLDKKPVMAQSSAPIGILLATPIG